jgi:hypothetical protein
MEQMMYKMKETSVKMRINGRKIRRKIINKIKKKLEI